MLGLVASVQPTISPKPSSSALAARSASVSPSVLPNLRFT